MDLGLHWNHQKILLWYYGNSGAIMAQGDTIMAQGYQWRYCNDARKPVSPTKDNIVVQGFQ